MYALEGRGRSSADFLLVRGSPASGSTGRCPSKDGRDEVDAGPVASLSVAVCDLERWTGSISGFELGSCNAGEPPTRVWPEGVSGTFQIGRLLISGKAVVVALVGGDAPVAVEVYATPAGEVAGKESFRGSRAAGKVVLVLGTVEGDDS